VSWDSVNALVTILTHPALTFLVGFFLGLLGKAIYLFKIQDLYERRKRHQELLVDSLKKWLKPSSLRSGIGDSPPIECPDPPRDFDKYVRQHLETGYPRAIKLFEDLKKISSDCVDKRSKLMERVRDIVSARDEPYRTTYDINSFVYVVIGEIKHRLRSSKVFEPVRKSEGRKWILKFGAVEVARSEDSQVLDKLESFFYELIQAEELRSDVKEIIEMDREYNEKFKELRGIIEDIITRFEHGNKLQGKCDICPKFFG